VKNNSTAETQKNNKRKNLCVLCAFAVKNNSTVETHRITREKNLCTLCAFAVKKFNRRDAEE
jgi:hypothetical protein